MFYLTNHFYTTQEHDAFFHDVKSLLTRLQVGLLVSPRSFFSVRK